jgi:hypothetical protein
MRFGRGYCCGFDVGGKIMVWLAGVLMLVMAIKSISKLDASLLIKISGY